MTRERHKATGQLARIAALPALLLAASAQGQAVQDYQLPPSRPSPAPTVAGPVDTDHPVVASTRPAPEPASSPSPVVVLPSPAATLSAAHAAGAPKPHDERQHYSQPETLPVPIATPAPEIPAVATEPAPILVAPTLAASPAAVAQPVPAAGKENLLWPWIAAGVAAAALIGGVFVRRIRRSAADVLDFETEPSAPIAREPGPRTTPVTPAPHSGLAATPPQEPGPDTPSRELGLAFEARHLSRAMVNAALAYRLTLTNRGPATLGPLRIAGDITSAHASLSAQEQLALDGGALALLHEVPALAPGEAAVLSGELRLPIASIMPIRSGASRVFVPLARFRVEAGNAVMATRVFVIGQVGEQPGGALRPFALDRGPGVERGLGQRELEPPG
jgi:hypothetical protein